jgi:hypothetical protein
MRKLDSFLALLHWSALAAMLLSTANYVVFGLFLAISGFFVARDRLPHRLR